MARNEERDAHRSARPSLLLGQDPGLFGRNPRWIMAAEIVETSRPWGRIAAEIAPEWIERTGAHLRRRHYADPHWSRKRGTVVAFEQVSLYGLVVVERRRVDFARVDPVEARRIFLREALVRGELDTRRGFIAHNRAQREAAEAMEHRRRRHDVLADEEALFAFFDARVPDNVVNAGTLEKWLARRGGDGILEVPREVIVRSRRCA